MNNAGKFRQLISTKPGTGENGLSYLAQVWHFLPQSRLLRESLIDSRMGWIHSLQGLGPQKVSSCYHQSTQLFCIYAPFGIYLGRHIGVQNRNGANSQQEKQVRIYPRMGR